MAAPGGIWAPMAQRILRHALAAGGRAAKALRSQIRSAAARAEQHQPSSSHQLAYVHVQQQPLHPVALRRQLKRAGNGSSKWFSTSSRVAGRSSSKWFSTSSRVAGRVSLGGSRFVRPANFLRATLQRFMSSGSGSGSSASRISTTARLLRSTVATEAVWKATGRAPFASTLRPNLTGGALPRTAGGYSTNGARGGARYFSHGPAAPAQVVQNVSQAMRAFWLSGQRARFDGCDSQGRSRYAAVSALEQETARRTASAAPWSGGAFIDFSLVPTVTACGGVAATAAATAKKTGLPKASIATPTLQTDGFLDVLGVDFARTLRDLGAVMADLKRLAALGDLPVTMALHGTALRVRFPGVDAATVDRLCEDLGITRGVVGEDPGGWPGVMVTAKAADTTTPALRFPFAPQGRAVDVLSDASDLSTEENGLLFGNAAGWPRHAPSCCPSFLRDADVDDQLADEGCFGEWADEGNPWRMSSLPTGSSLSPPLPPTASSGIHASSELESVEGVYRFLGESESVEGVYRFLGECERNRSLFG